MIARFSNGAAKQAFRARNVAASLPFAYGAAASRGAYFSIGAGMKILLVDDDPDVREYTALVLEDAGYAVRAAARGDEAEIILGTGEPFDLLITDIVMPGGDGVELARTFNRLRPDIKVLFTTGYTRHIAPELLADSEILDKPYQRAALLHAVRHLLGAKAPRTLA
jgi:CheY-like chemotaxis protein